MEAMSCRQIYTYVDPPVFLSVDSNFVSSEMLETLSAHSIELEEPPIDSPGAIHISERYHTPHRCVYQKLRSLLCKVDATDAEYLHMEVYVANGTIGPEGLFLMLLLFISLPLPARTQPSPMQFEK